MSSKDFVIRELLKDKHNKESLTRILRTLEKEDVIELFADYIAHEEQLVARIPLSAFIPELGPLESVVKFLKEELDFENRQIAKLLSKSQQSVWISYRNAQKKHRGRLPSVHTGFDLPITCLQNSRFSVLENIVIFLREKHDLKFSKIAGMLNRSQTTIWTTYNRAMKRKP